MNLKELAQFDVKDFKNIDYQAVLRQLKKRPDILVEIIAVITAVAFCVWFHSDKKADFAHQSQELSTLEQKYTIFQGIQRAQQVLKNLKEVLPPAVQESAFIDIISRNAAAHNINITSLSPASFGYQSAYSTISWSLNIVAPSYEQMWKFIYKLESDHKTLRVDSWSSRADMGGQRQRQRGYGATALVDPDAVDSSITLTIVNFKHE